MEKENVGKRRWRYRLFGVILFIVFAVQSAHADAASFSVSDSLEYNADIIPKNSFLDRIALRTNAFDWLLTVPNLGFEFDLSGSEFNSMTVGLSAKYNWNTYHNFPPPTVFNLFDVRPEFRYYYRTKPVSRVKTKWSVEKFLKERKNPRSWRANYVGAYVNYGTYTFKFGKKGMQGQAIGVGASAGYSIPMYEYRNGAVDVELGFSVGLQVCTRDMFAHNHDGNFYVPVKKGTKPLHFTPFPVVSDMRVAFVWRHKSIKDKVKEDHDRNRVQRQFDIIKGDYNYNDYTKASYDETLENTLSSGDRRQVMANDSLYFSGFVAKLDEQEATLRGFIPNAFSSDFKSDPRILEIVKEFEGKLEDRIVKGKKAALKKFKKDWRKVKSAENKALRKEGKARRKDEKELMKSKEPREKKEKKEVEE